jgi:hypothetical protein
MESSGIPVRDKPASVEVVSVDASLSTEGIYAKGVQPQPEDVVDDDASALGPLGGHAGTWWQVALV